MHRLLEEFSFDSIKTALNNPTEFVSPTKNPEDINILNQLINDSSSLLFQDYNTDNIESIKIGACAILNEGYGSLVIGVAKSPKINIIGIKIDEKRCETLLETILASINSPIIRSQYSLYQYNNRQVLVIRLKGPRHLYSINNDEIYLLKKNNNIVKADLNDIQNLVEKHLYNRLLKYQKVTQPKIDNLFNELTIFKDSTYQFILVNKIEKNAILLKDMVKLNIVKPFKGNVQISKINGNAIGNVFFIYKSEPRLPYAYLRCTCPRTNDYNITEFDIKRFKSCAIIIAPGGGVHYIDSLDDWCLISLDREIPSLVITLANLEEVISEYALIGWLKSSLFLWYCYTSLGGINIHIPSIFNNIPVPILKILKPKGQVEKLIKDIIEAEYIILSENAGNIVEYNNKLDIHNDYISSIANEIDKIFFKEFDITDVQEAMIKKFFECKKLYSIFTCQEQELAMKEVASDYRQDI